MRRREFLALVGGAGASALARPIAARGEESRVYRVGVLETVPAERNRANFGALQRGLRDHGYVDGQNLQITYRSADGRAVRFPRLAAELVRLPVDVIVTRGTPATEAAKAASATIPIVMAAIGEPLGVGVVKSFARPGGNITGFSSFVNELAGKRIELLKQAFPPIARVAFLQNIGNPVSPPQWTATQSAARSLGLAVELLDVRRTEDIAPAFATMATHQVQALSVGIDGLTQENAAMIVRLAAAQKLPAAYPAREFVEAGGLMSYGPSYPDLYLRAADLVDKILKGAKPGDLPVEGPAKLELVVNLKTATALGLDIPPTVLARADEVIE
ncbi:MAG TPA: ABC transporter substrate-binding protein [Xanthobacteraceae bacterium]|nr:ABC transporter substrate-binding protein [Xanthobacteraceae bacterium]